MPGSGVKDMQAWKHFRTITHHKRLVMRGCFRVGLYWQGLVHDLSKYSPVEFFVGARYYQGNMSPNNAERLDRGYSQSWLHHKGRNKHHLEYWIDYGLPPEGGIVGMRMPDKYIVEMFIDRVSASKVYQKDAYTDESAWKYYEKGKSHLLLHPEVRELLERLLLMLAEEGEEKTYDYIRREILKNK